MSVYAYIYIGLVIFKLRFGEGPQERLPSGQYCQSQSYYSCTRIYRQQWSLTRRKKQRNMNKSVRTHGKNNVGTYMRLLSDKILIHVIERSIAHMTSTYLLSNSHSIHIGNINQSTSSSKCICATRANTKQSIMRFNHITITT